METRGKFTREEIYSQPDSWINGIEVLKENTKAIQEFSQPKDYQQVIFTGCGSTYYLSCAAAAIFQEMTGVYARGLPASELWLSPHSYHRLSGRTILIAISRSGKTTETLNACDAFRNNNGGRILTFVCDPDSPLINLGVLNLIFPSGMEKSIAQTRAFSTLYLGVVGLCAIWSGQSSRFDQLNSLPLIGRRILNNYTSIAELLGKNLELDRIYFLGSGGRYGLACELNLKMKEMSLTHSEAFHFLEFRHGPKAMVNNNTLIVGLVSEINAGHELMVLKDIQDLGAKIITIGENKTDISFNSGLEEVIRNILYLPFGQMMAYERSIAKGLDPDHPNNLDSVVKLTK
jgi:glucosamine--fructose-6-phosphate aminotransferase (isomerizing)